MTSRWPVNISGVKYAEITPKGSQPSARLPTRRSAGSDTLYVLTGPFTSNSASVTALTSGEASEFDTRTPHGIASATH
jgi:hypothetical protein